MGLAWTLRERAGTLGAGRGGSWESLKDPQRGPAGAKLCMGPWSQGAKALSMKGQRFLVPHLPRGWDRELFLRYKEAEHE